MRRGSFLTVDGCRLAFEIEGEGLPVLWQHGLGATTAQPADVFPTGAGLQRITLVCRGHAGSELGDPALLTIEQFTGDAIALIDHLGIASATVGGISLGAAIALRLGALHPDRASALVLARPAWIDAPCPATQAAYVEVARHLRVWGAAEGRNRFVQTETYRALLAAAPDNAASMIGFFARPQPETTIELLSRLPVDGPGVSRRQMTEMPQHTLVIVTAEDHVHPAAYGRELASLIPKARLAEIIPKAQSRDDYVAEFRMQLAGFFGEGNDR